MFIRTSVQQWTPWCTYPFRPALLKVGWILCYESISVVMYLSLNFSDFWTRPVYRRLVCTELGANLGRFTTSGAWGRAPILGPSFRILAKPRIPPKCPPPCGILWQIWGYFSLLGPVFSIFTHSGYTVWRVP